MGHLLVLRFAMGAIVVAWAALRPEAVGIEFAALLVGTFGYLAVSTALEVIRRRSERFGFALLTFLLLFDGLYLAFAMYGTGGTQSPIRFLVYLDLVAVSLLASYRTGPQDRALAFAASVRRPVRPGRQAGPAHRGHCRASAIEFDRMPVLNVTSFWLFAIATSAFSALNERELRQRRGDLQSMVEIGGRLDDASDPLEQSRLVLAGLVERFEFKRGIVVGASDGKMLALATHGTEDVPTTAADPDWIVRRAWDRHEVLPVRRLDPGHRPVPRRGASRRAQPDRRPDDRRRPAGRRDRRRVRQALAAARRRAPGRLDGRPVRLDGGAEPPQRRPAATRPGPGRAGFADRCREPPDVPAEPGSRPRDRETESIGATRSRPSCSSTSTTSRSSTTRSAMPPATRFCVAVTGRITSLVRSTDLVARLGGDEFAILTEDEPDLARSRAMAERLIVELRAPYLIADRPVVVTSSIGIASARDAVDGATDLVRNADVAMYMAKANGKSGFAVFDPGMHVALRERNELSVELKRAIELDQFRLVYQPIVDLAKGGYVGVEALHPLAPPDARH